MNLHKPLLIPVLLLTCLQQLKSQADTAAAQIDPLIKNNQVKFKSVLRPLRQIAGAPEAFYSYFWEFGDGTYSFEKEPVHIYKDTGVYEVRLYATNNYDDGKKPPTRPRPIPVKRKEMLAVNKMPSFFSEDEMIGIKTNQQPRPGEDMVLLIGYRNKGNMPDMNGSLMLLYNEKQFSANSFDVAGVRAYNHERSIELDSLVAYAPPEETLVPQYESRQGLFTVSADSYFPPPDRQQLKQLLHQEMSAYRAHNIWRINNVKPGEEKFFFISVNTLPEMIKDTNAVVTIEGLFIPDDPSLDVEKFSLELQIVASHDPNRIMLRKRKLSYRFTGKNRDNIYKIQFQNTGKGPAKKVAVTVTVPGMLNAATVDLAGMKPFCTWCDSARAGQSCIDTVITSDSIQFIFNNIYLPGMQQEGVSDPDSTKGYVRYKIRFTKKMKKLPFTSRAAIVFDRNEPVYTNRSVGKFRKGFSPGIMVGYSSSLGRRPASVAPGQFVIGFTLSEYAPYRQYFQWELYLQPPKEFENFRDRSIGGDTILANGTVYKVDYRDVYERISIFSAEAVPLQLRYNISSYFSAGVGGLVSAEISRTTSRYEIAKLSTPNQTNTSMLEGETGRRKETWTSWRGGLFLDLQVGKVRAGPSAGIRFFHHFNPSHQRILLYATWRL